MSDNTKYIFKNKKYGKGRLVQAVVRQWVLDKKPNYEQLKMMFPTSLQGSRDVVISEQDLLIQKRDSKDTKSRYFDKDADKLTTSDGVTVYVTREWGIGNIDNFFYQAQQLGYEIQMVGSEAKSIRELFDAYKEDPRSDWIERYKNRCAEVEDLRSKPESFLTEDVLKGLWLNRSNGIASAGQGALTSKEFKNLLPDLPGVTAKILQNPSPETLDKIEQWAHEAKSQGKFSSIKWGVINRVFAAADPSSYGSILPKSAIVELIESLNHEYGFSIKTEGNWCEVNSSLMRELRAHDLAQEDMFFLNTFVWDLYESLRKIQSGESGQEVSEVNNATKLSAPCENKIYYGPPGTGKTYCLQQLLKSKYTDDYALPDETAWLSAHIETLSWHEVIILVLMEADEPQKVTEIVNHEYYQLKAQLNDRDKNLRATAWAALQSHTVSDSKTVNLSRRIEPLVFDKTEDSRWFLHERQVDQLEDMKVFYDQLKAGPEEEETIKRFEFVTFHQSFSYEEFIEGLRPRTNDAGDIEYRVEPGVFKRISRRAEADPDNQYALVIDEINRGNISKIFGELITLIEVDKRSGCDNELTLTLPYSGSTFSVPSNLDIIGTMNTADRSLTHIDVALRRRFHFIELRTDYSLIPENVTGINLRWMLYAINQRIELLLDREHILGHALLMHASSLAEIGHVFKTNIMPLLEEYFFENWDKINQVLNDNGFIQEQKDAYNTWLGNTDDYAAKSYRINVDAMQSVEAYQQIYAQVDPSAFAELNKLR